MTPTRLRHLGLVSLVSLVWLAGLAGCYTHQASIHPEALPSLNGLAFEAKGEPSPEPPDPDLGEVTTIDGEEEFVEGVFDIGVALTDGSLVELEGPIVATIADGIITIESAAPAPSPIAMDTIDHVELYTFDTMLTVTLGFTGFSVLAGVLLVTLL